MEPTSTAAGGFAIAKLYSGLAGLFTGMLVMFLRKEPNLKGHGRAASGAIVGGISVGSSVIFSGAAAVYMGMDANDANTALAVGGGIGLFAVGVITAVANFLDKNEDKDMFEIAQSVRSAVSSKAPVAKKVAAKKVAAKKPVAKRAPRKTTMKGPK